MSLLGLVLELLLLVNDVLPVAEADVLDDEDGSE
jgi:hypothetical protein